MKKYFAATLIALSFPCFAASGGSGFVEIKQLRIGGGFARISGVSQFTDPSDCSGSGTNKNTEMLVMEGTPSYKEIVSILLSAKLTNTPVQFWVSGCETDSGKQYPNAKFVYIR